jgi:putative transposase
VSDGSSRYLIKCEGLTEPRDRPTREHFEKAFREFGSADANPLGQRAPFATKAIGGLSKLSVWWVQQLGIVPERIEPGKPQQNGRHERMHRTLKDQTAAPPQATLADPQRAFDRFRRDYNDHRPHEALGQTPRARHYEPSLRSMPERPRELQRGDGFEVRRVRPDGKLSFNGHRLPVGSLLASQPLGLKPVDDDEWEVLYGPLPIGVLLVRAGKPRIEPSADARFVSRGCRSSATSSGGCRLGPGARSGGTGLAHLASRSLSPRDPVCAHEQIGL